MNPVIATLAKSDLYALLPSVDEWLHHRVIEALVHAGGQQTVVDIIRGATAKIREQIALGKLDTPGAVNQAVAQLPHTVLDHVQFATEFSLRHVINATGVILHTNLGRAPLAEAALKHLNNVASSYSNLEFELASGNRGKRDVHVERLFSRLLNRISVTGIRTVVVNNCAAAVMLALNTLAQDGEVIVSRGELVEIGGSFRVPDVMSKSGATLREVGTTNRTRIEDYERAITKETKLLLRVHRSNFSIIGFTEQPSLQELVVLGRKHNVPVMEDLGGGALMPLCPLGIDEAGISDSLRAGIDLVTYSGDKMLGGPQSGILSGREDLIKRIRSNPLFRALRVDKLIYAALEATLLEYLRENYDAIPFTRMIRVRAQQIHNRAQAIRDVFKHERNLEIEILAGESLVGGGSAPSSVLPTFLLAISARSLSADDLAKTLRMNNPPIVGRVERDRFLLDLRTVLTSEQDEIVHALWSLAKTLHP